MLHKWSGGKMTKCYVCDISINEHDLHELQKCLSYSGDHQKKIDKLVMKLAVLVG